MNRLSESQINEIISENVGFHFYYTFIYNLNQSGADLEMFYNTLGFMFQFFPQDLFFVLSF